MGEIVVNTDICIVKELSIGILDDHPAMLSAIAMELTQHSYAILFKATHPEALFEYLKKDQPDLLIADILMPDATGIEVFEKVHSLYPDVKVISYSSLGSPILVENLLDTGVKGYVHKGQPLSDLSLAVNTVTNGKIYLPAEYHSLLTKYRITERKNLTRREIQIVGMIANEMTSKAIAEQLFISVNTVENHRKHIFEKLGAKNLAGMILEAARRGYIS